MQVFIFSPCLEGQLMKSLKSCLRDHFYLYCLGNFSKEVKVVQDLKIGERRERGFRNRPCVGDMMKNCAYLSKRFFVQTFLHLSELQGLAFPDPPSGP